MAGHDPGHTGHVGQSGFEMVLDLGKISIPVGWRSPVTRLWVRPPRRSRRRPGESSTEPPPAANAMSRRASETPSAGGNQRCCH